MTLNIDDVEFRVLCDEEINVFNNDGIDDTNDDQEGYSTLNVQVSTNQEDDELRYIRIRLYTEDAIRFIYEIVINQDVFNKFKTEQELDFEFDEFPNVLQRILKQLNKDFESEEGYKAVIETSDDYCVLSFQQALEYCTTEIFKFHIKLSTRLEVLSQQRYDDLCRRVEQARTQLKDLVKRIRRQDPKILNDFRITFLD